MDVTPQLLKEVEFREKFRGYDPDEVDDFLERVGLAFTQAQDKLREASDQIEAANARAARAEARARDSSDIDDTLRRTLVLAQRTADAAVAEAREQAASIVGEAQNQARQHLGAAEERTAATNLAADEAARRHLESAEGQAAQLLQETRQGAERTVSSANEQANRLLMDARRQAEEIQNEARTSADQAAEARRTELAAEVAALTSRASTLRDDADKLEAYLSAGRRRVESVATELRKLLDDPSSLTAAPVPELQAEPTPREAPPQLLRTNVEAGPGGSEGATAPPVASSTDLDEQAAPVAPTAIAETAVDRDRTDRELFEAVEAVEAEEAEPTVDHDQDRTAAFSILDDEDESPAPMSGPASEPDGDGSRSGPSWATGGPPPPPPPPRHVPFASEGSGSQRPGPPPPPPPPPPSPVAQGGFGADESPVIGAVEAPQPAEPAAPIAPWLSSRVPSTSPVGAPAAPAVHLPMVGADPTTAPAPPRDSFLDELRRAVGEGGDSEQAGAATAENDDALRFFEDRDSTDPAAKFLDREGESSRTWFGRKR